MTTQNLKQHAKTRLKTKNYIKTVKETFRTLPKQVLNGTKIIKT